MSKEKLPWLGQLRVNDRYFADLVMVVIVVVIAPLFVAIAMRVASLIGVAVFIIFPMMVLLLMVLTVLPAHFVIFVVIVVAFIAVVVLIMMVLLNYYAVVMTRVPGYSGCHAKATERHDDCHGS